MAITSGLVRFDVRYSFLGQQCQTSMHYSPEGVAWLTATGDGAAQAYWNDVKTLWRALVPAGSSFQFQTVNFEEIGGSLSFGEYAIPPAEINGTRTGTSGSDFLPSYCAVGVRLSVGTRSTRPGQKRVPGLMEIDSDGTLVLATFLGLVTNLAAKWKDTLTMGAPVALGTLRPVVVHFPTTPDPEQRQQNVVGFVVNQHLTSQVSRRFGHGN